MILNHKTLFLRLILRFLKLLRLEERWWWMIAFQFAWIRNNLSLLPFFNQLKGFIWFMRILIFFKNLQYRLTVVWNWHFVLLNIVVNHFQCIFEKRKSFILTHKILLYRCRNFAFVCVCLNYFYYPVYHRAFTLAQDLNFSVFVRIILWQVWIHPNPHNAIPVNANVVIPNFKVPDALEKLRETQKCAPEDVDVLWKGNICDIT